MMDATPNPDNTLQAELREILQKARYGMLDLSPEDVYFLDVTVSAILAAIQAKLPKSYKDKVGLDVALLWDSQDATDGYNEALTDTRKALGIKE